ncbi:MAG: four helix bundle protein [Nitrospira sp.]|jgi:four helix bundle protein|nr:four helix bundle protein [Nitrospira sp.]MBP6606851.1 four helix bundle protein [Nitrospira sp.]HQY59531.1 four helix bundle protein [Nitrospira sp.]HRA96131.1 four helix bundle protein [Nitrospira sp.]
MRDFKTLTVWKTAHQLTLNVYKDCASFSKDEAYGLVSQMRRASVSIASNIAEGCGRESNLEMARFLSIAAGSASELQYQILLAGDLGILDEVSCADLERHVIEVRKMASSFMTKLKTKS